ncbi:MAG: hypothetical protein VKN33_05640 [Candidatus Sericytochromatia bacterium]|nr:hypothetical protein [Candidatus Sericytochromatia bacterium]
MQPPARERHLSGGRLFEAAMLLALRSERESLPGVGGDFRFFGMVLR